MIAQIRFCFAHVLLLYGNWESQRTLYTFANRTSLHTSLNLQKSAIYP